MQGGTLHPAFDASGHSSLAHVHGDFGQGEPGKVREDVVVHVAGRVTSRREMSKNLVFLDITENSRTLQICLSKKRYTDTGRFKDDVARGRAVE